MRLAPIRPNASRMILTGAGEDRNRLIGIARGCALPTRVLATAVSIVLSMGAGVGMSISAAYSALFLLVPLLSRPGASFSTAAGLASIGLVGVAAGSMIIWSNLRRGRRSWVGLALALLYLGASVAPPVFLTTAHHYGPIALALVALAVLNMLWHTLRPRVTGQVSRRRRSS